MTEWKLYRGLYALHKKQGWNKYAMTTDMLVRIFHSGLN